MTAEEILDALEYLIAQRIRSHVQARGYDRLSVVAQFVGGLVKRHGLSAFFDEEYGFLPGEAREEFSMWYLSMFASASQLNRPLVREVLYIEGFERARKVLTPALGARRPF